MTNNYLIKCLILSVISLNEISLEIIEPNATVLDVTQETPGQWVSLPEDEMAILLPDRNSSPIHELKEHFEKLNSNSKNNATEKFMFEKQISDKYPKTRVVAHMEVEAIYHCTPQSVVSVLTFHSDFDNYFVCNQVLDLSHDLKLNLTMKKRFYKVNRNYAQNAVTIRDMPVQIVFFKGNQIYHSSGQINQGACAGDQLTIISMALAKKGSCKARSGLQQSMSETAMLTISGKCQSQCFGDVNVVFNPGLRF